MSVMRGQCDARSMVSFLVNTHTHTHSVLPAMFPGNHRLAGFPLNSPSLFILIIPELRILLGQT